MEQIEKTRTRVRLWTLKINSWWHNCSSKVVTSTFPNSASNWEPSVKYLSLWRTFLIKLREGCCITREQWLLTSQNVSWTDFKYGVSKTVQRCVELFEGRRLESDVTCSLYTCLYESTIRAPSILNELLWALLALPKRVKGDEKEQGRKRTSCNKNKRVKKIIQYWHHHKCTLHSLQKIIKEKKSLK